MASSGNYIEIAGGETIETYTEDYELFAEGSIVSEAGGMVIENGKENGMSYNAPKDPPPAKIIDAKATVVFRPAADWKGEFMFDWMRTGEGAGLGQTNILGDVDYKTIVGYYNDNFQGNPFIPDTRDADHNGVKDLYQKLKKEYEVCTMANKSDANGHPAEYLAPILGLYKNENDTAKAIAVLQLQIEVIEKPDELILEYDSTYFDISEYIDPNSVVVKSTLAPKPNAPTPYVNADPKIKKLKLQRSVTGDSSFNTVTIQIECVAVFATDQEIKAYTIMANPDPAKADKIKKLAGVLRVVANDRTKRKVKKFLLINVQTDFNTDGVKEEGLILAKIQSEKDIIRKILRQAFIDPIFAVETLNISGLDLQVPDNRIRDEFNRRYIVGGKLKCYYQAAETAPAGWQDIDVFLNTQFTALISNRYPNYIKIFYVNQNAFYIDSNGAITPPLNSREGLGGFTPASKNIVITGNADLTSSAHEILHALMLPHTWESKNHIKPGGRNPIQEPFAKHSFKFEQTYNVMDYGKNSTQYFLYYWQCLVANAHAVAEPVNYITVS